MMHTKIREPVRCACGQCGGPATIYPVPAPKGSCVCEACTPAWFRDFVRFLMGKEADRP